MDPVSFLVSLALKMKSEWYNILAFICLTYIYTFIYMYIHLYVLEFFLKLFRKKILANPLIFLLNS